MDIDILGPRNALFGFDRAPEQHSGAFWLGMGGYPTRLSGSGRISTIRQNPTPVGLHVTCHIGLAPITASTSVGQSAAAAVWFAACVERLANYSNRPSRQVSLLIGLYTSPTTKYPTFVPVCFTQAVT